MGPDGAYVCAIKGDDTVTRKNVQPSQVLTLYTTPVIYLYLDRLSHRMGRLRRAKLDQAHITAAAAE